MKLSNIPRYICNPKLALDTFRLKYNDRFAIETLWKSRMDFPLDLDNPKRLTEKLQWIKLNDHNPIYTTLADKYRLKEWVSNNIGSEYVVPTIATYTSAKDIDLEKLPNQFVIKCNHDSGSVFICYDKEKGIFVNKEMVKFEWDDIKIYLSKALKRQYFYASREWPYKNIKHLILVEPIISAKSGKLPTDIKLFYANGEFLFAYVSFGRDGVNDRCTYDRNWERLPFVWMDPQSYRKGINTSNVPRPAQYDKMIETGAKIAENCKFCRVDFYDVEGAIIIGEITFFHGGGYDRFYPDEYDFVYGEKLKLD